MMPDYLDQFFIENVGPYKKCIEPLPLDWRIEIREEARRALMEGIDAAFDNRIPIHQSTLEERLKRICEVTAQLGVDMGILLLNKSANHFRIGEDYAEIYSTVMGLFGEDEMHVKSKLLEAFEPDISKDRTLRKAIEAILN